MRCTPECSTPPPGSTWGHCSACHHDFRSDRAFDMHRTGPASDRRCMTVDEMLVAGMALNDKFMWVTEPWMPLEHRRKGTSSPELASQVSREGSGVPIDSRAAQQDSA